MVERVHIAESNRIALSEKGARKRRLTATVVRSAITNGTDILANVDHRTADMRRLRDLITIHEADLGGEAHITEAERRLVRRAAFLTLQAELIEQRWATRDDIGGKSIELYGRLTNTLRRLLESLGLQRRSRDVTPPTVDEYLRRINRQEAVP